jgi:hypothetical protein
MSSFKPRCNEKSDDSCCIFICIRKPKRLHKTSMRCSFLAQPALNYTATFFFNFYFFSIHMCIQCLGHFSPLPPPPPLPPIPPPPSPLPPSRYPAETILPLFLILLKREYKHNKKEQGFLLVEIRIAIQGVDSR